LLDENEIKLTSSNFKIMELESNYEILSAEQEKLKSGESRSGID
jgi:hypothetical protein